MSVITDIVNGLGGGLLDGITKLIGSTNTTDKERLALQNEAQKLVFDFTSKVNDQLVKIEQELTKRQANDMQSDSWLSKNVRPLVLVFLIVSTVLLAYITTFVLDTARADLLAPWIAMLTNLDMAAIGFYFGSIVQNLVGRRTLADGDVYYCSLLAQYSSHAP